MDCLACMTPRREAVGLGQRDAAVFRYSPRKTQRRRWGYAIPYSGASRLLLYAGQNRRFWFINNDSVLCMRGVSLPSLGEAGLRKGLTMRSKKILSWRGQCMVKELLERDIGLASWQLDLLGDVFNKKRFSLRQLDKLECIYREVKEKGLLRQ